MCGLTRKWSFSLLVIRYDKCKLVNLHELFHSKIFRIGKISWWLDRGVYSLMDCIRLMSGRFQDPQENLIARWLPLVNQFIRHTYKFLVLELFLAFAHTILQYYLVVDNKLSWDVQFSKCPNLGSRNLLHGSVLVLPLSYHSIHIYRYATYVYSISWYLIGFLCRWWTYHSKLQLLLIAHNKLQLKLWIKNIDEHWLFYWNLHESIMIMRQSLYAYHTQ